MKIDKVTKYLVCSYLYYIKYDTCPISDLEYDTLCRELLAEFDTIEHELKYLLDKDSLRAGTGYQIGDQHYPSQIKALANDQ